MQNKQTLSESLLCGRQVYRAISFYQHTLARYKDEEQEAQKVDNLPKVTQLVWGRGHQDSDLFNTKAIIFPLLQPTATKRAPSLLRGHGFHSEKVWAVFGLPACSKGSFLSLIPWTISGLPCHFCPPRRALKNVQRKKETQEIYYWHSPSICYYDVHPAEKCLYPYKVPSINLTMLSPSRWYKMQSQ